MKNVAVIALTVLCLSAHVYSYPGNTKENKDVNEEIRKDALLDAAKGIITQDNKIATKPEVVAIAREPEDAIVSDGIVPEEITKYETRVEDSIVHELKSAVEDVLKVADVEDDEEIPEMRVSYAGSQLWRVVLDNTDKKIVIKKLHTGKDISMWGGNQTAVDILVREPSKNAVRSALVTGQINYEIVIDDVQQAIDDENPSNDVPEQELGNRQGEKSYRLTWSAYHRLHEIHEYVDYLAATYPNLCTIHIIGYSVQGRPLKVLKISNGNPTNKAVWVDGGMHAREWISPATTTYIMNNLVLNFEDESKIMQNIDWHFLPVANPDGYEYSHTVDRLWRKNRARSGACAGTDLNRNFGYKWGGKGSGKNPCQEIYAGTGAFSEPESAAIRNYITGTSDAKWRAYVSFHSYGQYILFPWGYDRVITTDNADLQRVAYKAASAIREKGGPNYTVGPAGATLYPASGGSDDWAKGVAKMKYAYTIELRDSGRYGFVLPASFIKPTAIEAFAALRVIGEAASAA